MKKKLFLILGITTFLILAALFGYINASKINLTDFTVTYLDIEDAEVPESFKDKTIIFISDLEYGTYFKEKRLEQFKKKISGLNADIVIFAGDMFDKDFVPISSDVNILTDLFSSIDARLGKFAIFGDFDLISDQRKALVSKVLYDSNFEMLDNNPIRLHNGQSEHINLIGIDYIPQNIDLSSAFANVQQEDYTITVIHGGNVANILPVKMSNLILSGHSHHCQINLPFMLDDSYSQTGGFAHGKYKVNNVLMYITNGIGTTGQDYRAFSDPEIVYITFK